MQNHKKCCRCQTTQDIENFYSHCSSRDRRQPYCKDCCKQVQLERQIKNRCEWNSYLKEYNRERYATDIQWRMSKILRSHIRHAMMRAKAKKSQNTIKLLGCDWQTFCDHIASQFTGGMTWDLVGKEIHLDHIRPVSSYDLTDPVQQRQCFHYTNYQPMWAKDNLQKHSTYNGCNNHRRQAKVSEN